MNILEKAQEMLEKYPLCDHCIGRQFALLGYGLENSERGSAIKTLLIMKGHKLALLKDKNGISLLKDIASNGSSKMATEILRKMNRRSKVRKKCFLCNNRFEELSPMVDSIAEKIEKYEYETFLIGIKLPVEIAEREDEFKAKFDSLCSEGMKNEFSRIIGKMITKTLSKEVDFSAPSILIVVNPFSGELQISVNSIFIKGRYRKLVRGLPQTKWFCGECRGTGCQKCKWTGKAYPLSVEEIIAEPALQATGGEKAVFHGAGREDIDALMLGNGRPFVIEIKQPKKRELNLKNLEEEINRSAKGKIEVSKLKSVGKEWVRNIKHRESTRKAYRVSIKFDRQISDKEIKILEDVFSETVVKQQTPRRVLHRRADIVREKHIYETKIRRLTHTDIEMKILCQGGLYVKELVTGDDGRTVPSVSDVTKSKAEPMDLDVLKVDSKGGG